MPRLRDILAVLETIAPKRFAFSFDKVGLQVGDQDSEVVRAVVTLDRSLAAVEHAKQLGASLVLAHHPLIFRPIESVDTRSHVGRTIMELVKSDISFVAAHTNWDSAQGGINDALASLLDLTDVSAFGSAADVAQLKIVVTAPHEHLQAIIDAASEQGAGVIGEYHRCAFVSSGTGLFDASDAAKPAVGRSGERTTAVETRIEMIVPAEAMIRVDRAIRRVHAYETPAIDFYPLHPLAEQPAGRVGSVAPTTFIEFVSLVESRLCTKALGWGNPEKKIRTVAVVGGSADDEWRNAQRAGADVLITGEVKQHSALEASESGICLISAGHYATEQPGCEALRAKMSNLIPDVEWSLFTPVPGQSGRPLN